MQGQNDSIGRTRTSELVLNQLRGVRLVSAGGRSERRERRDRRRLTVWSVLYGGLRPRRRVIRREADHSLPVVDWHEAHLLAIAIGIVLLCCADAFLTLHLLVLGAREANPFMAALIHSDVTMFAAVKMGLTGVGVLVLVLLARCRIFGRFRVVSALYAALAIYCALVTYEVTLLFHLL
jgi:hypothetical protein